jgi:NADH dehydrogenase
MQTDSSAAIAPETGNAPESRELHQSRQVLVTGGTGFVGTEIVRHLSAAGHRIFLLARNPQSPRSREFAARFNAKLKAGNILDPDSLTSTCSEMDAVIHLVGIISEIRDQTFERVHTGGTRNIVAAAKAAGVRRFIHMSALGSRPGAVARYHRSKWAAEEVVRGCGLDWTVFRPSIIYGPGDGFVNLFARISRFSPVVPIMGSGRSRFRPLPVTSVARAFVGSLEESRAIGETFDLCGNEILTLEEIIDAILRVTGRRRLKLHVPLAIARVQAAFLEFIYPRLFGKAPPLNRDQIVMLQEDHPGDGRPAAELFRLPTHSFHGEITHFLRHP